jgi:hypothetical protein
MDNFFLVVIQMALAVGIITVTFMFVRNWSAHLLLKRFVICHAWLWSPENLSAGINSCNPI